MTLEFDSELHNLDQYKDDLQAVKDMISDDAADAVAAGSQLNHVILVGHVTVAYTGWFQYDSGTHGGRAFGTDLYYADAQASPQTWGDFWLNLADGGDHSHELTTNEVGDGRFDANGVPGDQQTITVSGSSGEFILGFNGVDIEDSLPYNASAATVQSALNSLGTINGNPGIPWNSGWVTVTKSGNVYTVTFFGQRRGTTTMLTGSGIGGASVSIATLDNGGLEYAVGRIDMANLDAMSPNEDDTAEEIEIDQLNQYFQRNHEWRWGAR
ncbi:MAG: hypothetical protein ACREJC_13830, partial [Tepidisphaeraceae bacterium]